MKRNVRLRIAGYSCCEKELSYVDFAIRCVANVKAGDILVDCCVSLRGPSKRFSHSPSRTFREPTDNET